MGRAFCSCKARIHHIPVNKCPVDLREKKIQVRFDRNNKQRFIVYFNDQRMGEATPVNLIYNANRRKSNQVVMSQ